MTTKKTRNTVHPAEARQILARKEAGATINQLSAEFSRSNSTISRVIKNSTLYEMTREERWHKGTPIPFNAREKQKQSLRNAPSKTAEESQYDPQVSNSQLNFDFAVALLKKATAIVEALGRQQHPPELVALVKATIEAAVQLEVQTRIADNLDYDVPEVTPPERTPTLTSPLLNSWGAPLRDR